LTQSFDTRSCLLAIVTSTGSIFILLYGLGIGSPPVTAAVLIGSIAALLMVGDRSRFLVTEIDALFLAFLTCIAISLAINGWPDSQKDTVLLALSLAAYPAGRTIPRGEIGLSFILVGAAIVTTGLAVTTYALAEQWSPLLDRPAVFGYSSAAALFVSSLGFLLIALASGPWLNNIRTKIVCAALCVPVFVFGFSLVRFKFMAIALALAAVAASSGRDQRRRIYAIIAAIVALMAAGLLTRDRVSQAVFGFPVFAAEQIRPPGVVHWTPQCGVNANSSLAVRTVLMREAITTIPDAGWFGIGFTNFGKVTCFSGTYPHNSILQALIEFGWLGGTLFTLLVLTALWYTWSAARASSEARFVFGCVVYVVTIGLAHGSLGQDMLLFLFMGYAGRIDQDAYWSNLQS
jgi:O-antigen ligase